GQGAGVDHRVGVLQEGALHLRLDVDLDDLLLDVEQVGLLRALATGHGGAGAPCSAASGGGVVGDGPRVCGARGRAAQARRLRGPAGRPGPRAYGGAVSRRASLLTILAVVLVALNLRGAIAAVPPVLEDLQVAVGLTTAQAALMTSLPVLLFALAAPLAARLGRRLGPGRAVLVGLALIGAGTLVRVLGGPVVLLLGTAVVGLGITI